MTVENNCSIALVSAHYVYDGDGNLVEGDLNGVITYCPPLQDAALRSARRHYNMEVDGEIAKHSRRVAETVKASSASVTANEDGTWNSEIRYIAFAQRSGAWRMLWSAIRAAQRSMADALVCHSHSAAEHGGCSGLPLGRYAGRTASRRPSTASLGNSSKPNWDCISTCEDSTTPL